MFPARVCKLAHQETEDAAVGNVSNDLESVDEPHERLLLCTIHLMVLHYF